MRIAGSAKLDVRHIDLSSISLAGVASVVVKNDGTFQAAYENGGNGYTDLVVHVSREALAAAGMLSHTTYQVRVDATLDDGCTAYTGRQALQVN